MKNEKHEFTLSQQILRSGTSIGANIEEDIGAQSEADYISKFSIAYKEARETFYSPRLLCGTNYLTKEMSDSLFYDAEEICWIIGKIQITSKETDILTIVIRNSNPLPLTNPLKRTVFAIICICSLSEWY